VAESLSDVALADAGLPKQQGVLTPFDESASSQVEHLCLRHLRVEMEIKVLQGLLVLEVRAAHALVELLGVAPLDLVLDEAIQEFLIAQVVVCCLPQSQLGRLQHPTQAQLF